MKILELGGGHNPFPFDDTKHSVKRIDWNTVNADVVHDLNKFPYPFADNEFDLVYSSHCIEHLSDKNKVFWEIHRILKDDGRAIIRVPHITSIDAWNFDHVSVWKTGSLNCLVNAAWYGAKTFPKFALISEKLHWRTEGIIRFNDTLGEYCVPKILENIGTRYSWYHNIIYGAINKHKWFSEQFLSFWLLGINEIEYVIKAEKK